MVPGFDASHHNGNIAWDKVAASGQGFAFLKASEGLYMVDYTFAPNLKAAMSNGLVAGAYHFFHPLPDAVQQAKHFLSTFDNTMPIFTAIDTEWTGDEWDKLSVDDGCKAVQEFLDIVTQATGRKPFLYFSPSFASQYLAKLSMDGYPLWVAKYGNIPPENYTIWQYSEKGTVPGMLPGTVDLNRFEGSLDDLKSMLGT